VAGRQEAGRQAAGRQCQEESKIYTFCPYAGNIFALKTIDIEIK
jgi:hypothetical protein